MVHARFCQNKKILKFLCCIHDTTSCRASMNATISVIVATYNRKAMVRRLLDSCALLESRCPLEFIIVDDCSDDGTGSLIEDWKKTHAAVDLTCIRLTARSGPAKARNAGIARAQGTLIAFTDSDCTVDPHWIEHLHTWLIDHPGQVGVGGRVLPMDNDVYSCYNTLFHVLEPSAKEPRSLVGANFMVWKQPVIEVGMFDDWFSLPGGEETALCMKLWSRGYRFGFQPAAIVWHEYRHSLRAFIRTFLTYGAGERILFENRLAEYLRSGEYPEKAGGVLARRHPVSFRISFLIGVLVHTVLQASSLRSVPLSPVRRIQLFGLSIIHHLGYHLGRGTFSGALGTEVQRYLRNNPGCLVTPNPGTNPGPPLIEISGDTVPEYLRPGRSTDATVTVKNTSPSHWVSMEFLIELSDGRGEPLVFRSAQPLPLLLAPGAESVYSFRFMVPAQHTSLPVIITLVSPAGRPVSAPTGKKILVVSPDHHPDAEILDRHFPQTLVVGEQVSVSIRLRNTGNVTWSEKNQIRLGSVGDAGGTGALFGDIRIRLPADVRIPPGAEAGFTFRITAPERPGTYPVRYRMVWENTSWFGEVIEQSIQVQAG